MKNSIAKSLLRFASFSSVKSLVDDEYEDACYELAYSLEPILFNLIKKTGLQTNTQILKIFLKNKDIYGVCKQINDELVRVRKECETTYISCQLNFASKLNEYYQCLVNMYTPIYMKIYMQKHIATGL
jgi:hypothetical protein